MRFMHGSKSLLHLGLGLLSLLCSLGCQSEPQEPPALTREELLNPESCKDCHPKYYREWSSSMHAYSTTDPVFLAMNKRGQEETNGALGKLCVQCHAPMAVLEGAIQNYADLSQVPKHLQGVTCYFCHNAVEVGPDHFNANIKLANDNVMRANLRNPIQPTAHGVKQSELHNARSMRSSELCGTCHDIRMPSGVHLERTFEEYSTSLVAQPNDSFQSCQSCHMDTAADPEQVAVSTGREGQLVTRRDAHEHLWAAVDVPLTDGFPNAIPQRSAVEMCELQNSIVYFSAVMTSPFNLQVAIETNAGHSQPSGSSHDRRMWLEIRGYDASGKQVYASGVVPDGQVEETPENPHPFMMRDRIRNAKGEEVHMFWDAMPQPTPSTADSQLLPPATLINTATNPRHSLERTYNVLSVPPPVRYVMELRMRPMGLDVLLDLVKTGHLDPAVVQRMPTLSVTTREFRVDPSSEELKLISRSEPDCSTYRCMLNPQSSECVSP